MELDRTQKINVSYSNRLHAWVAETEDLQHVGSCSEKCLKAEDASMAPALAVLDLMGYDVGDFLEALYGFENDGAGSNKEPEDNSDKEFFDWRYV